jgi:5'-nucleotidase
MRLADRRHLLPGAAAFSAALLVALLGITAGAREQPGRGSGGTVELQLLGVNDLHGHLEPPEPGVGGVAWLGAWLDRLTGSHPARTIRVHAGDMVGASPLISSHFHDEPTIEATNMMEFDVGTLGNHEFDEGGAEALRLASRARYPYVAANTVTRDGGELILPPYEIVERAGVKVGFIGVTTVDTPYFLLSEFARRYRWLDLSDSVNRWVPELRRRGVEAIVVVAHAGAFQEGANGAGEVVDEAREMDDAVDVIVAGHTHSRLNLRVDGKLVVEALSYGVAFDRVRLEVDRITGDVVRAACSPRATRGSSPMRSSPAWSSATPIAWRRSASASSGTRRTTSTTRRSTPWP